MFSAGIEPSVTNAPSPCRHLLNRHVGVDPSNPMLFQNRLCRMGRNMRICNYPDDPSLPPLTLKQLWYGLWTELHQLLFYIITQLDASVARMQTLDAPSALESRHLGQLVVPISGTPLDLEKELLDEFVALRMQR